MKRVEGKVCVVTGGARGLGLAAAEALIAEGARVAITDLDRAAGEQAAARLGANAVFMSQNVTDAAQWETVLGDARTEGADVALARYDAAANQYACRRDAECPS